MDTPERQVTLDNAFRHAPVCIVWPGDRQIAADLVKETANRMCCQALLCAGPLIGTVNMLYWHHLLMLSVRKSAMFANAQGGSQMHVREVSAIRQPVC